MDDDVFYKWGGGLGPDLLRIERAEREFLYTADGDRIVDAAAGAAVANLGHSLDVGDAYGEQAAELGYVSLSRFAADPPSDLAARLAEVTPGDLTAAFFGTSGSEAIETAIKLARAYHRERGRPEKSVVISRWESYHGATLGALSASGNTGRREAFTPLLHRWPKIPPAYPYRWSYDGTPEEQAIAAASELEDAIRREGPDSIAAFLFEPVSGASIPAAHPHPAYFQEVRRICDAYDVLLIADEVMTGFGRTGRLFACDRFEFVPDVLVLGKGLAAGYAPVSATVVREEIAEAFDAEDGGSFAHGHTYFGHPPTAAVALEVLDRYTDDVFAQGRAAGERLEENLTPLSDHPMVGDLRRCGLMVGVELVADRATKEPFEPSLDVAERVYDRALAEGVYVYPGGGSVAGTAGDHLMLAPPLTTSDESIDRIGAVVTDAIDAVHAEVTGS